MSYAHNYWTSNDRPRIPHGEMRSLLVQPGRGDLLERLYLTGHDVTVTSSLNGWSAACTCGAHLTAALLSDALNLHNEVVATA